MTYLSVFFDLDHTLWDYETNSEHTLIELYEHYSLFEKGIHNPQAFTQSFTKVNNRLWDAFNKNQISSQVIRKNRFEMIFGEFGLKDDLLADQLARAYLEICPSKGKLLPHAMEVLDYLQPRYQLFIITNGFNDVQQRKLKSSGITDYFTEIITSESVGHKKPAREIFDHAIKLSGHQNHEVVMIGDNLEADIKGASQSEIDTIYFNPGEVQHQEYVVHEIISLRELLIIL